MGAPWVGGMCFLGFTSPSLPVPVPPVPPVPPFNMACCLCPKLKGWQAMIDLPDNSFFMRNVCLMFDIVHAKNAYTPHLSILFADKCVQ